MNIRLVLALAACCVLWSCAGGAPRARTGTPGCPSAQEVAQAHMLGWWRAEIGEPAEVATLLLEKNANYPDSFSGAVYRGSGERSGAAGDVEEGDFTLEETADGVRITATWTGEVVEGSCGREIRGSWQASLGRTERPFVLRRLPGS